MVAITQWRKYKITFDLIDYQQQVCCADILSMIKQIKDLYCYRIIDNENFINQLSIDQRNELAITILNFSVEYCDNLQYEYEKRFCQW